MRVIKAAAAGAAALAMLMAPPLQMSATAHGGGFGGGHLGHGHFGHPFRSGFREGFGPWWPLYGGYVDLPPAGYGDFITYVLPEPVIPASQPPPPLQCQHSEETVTVPAEDGGTRQIRIVRC